MGQRLGDYLLDEEISHGGMGVVYRARQISLDRVVAVKLLLLGRYSAAKSIERFRREAQSAAAIRHPNIVAIHEVGEADGQHFFSMEYVEGRNLAELLRRGPMDSRRAAEIAFALADATHFAHSRGILHRDLKPSNVLIDALGQVKITDFGLAKRLDEASDLTVTGQMVGTPNYLSPEAAAGLHREVGPASDVYSVGAILYELLSGRPPFLAQSLQETLLRIRDTEAVGLRRQNRAIPADLETICLKCLGKRPAQRYRCASDLAEDLRRFLDGEPIKARPVSAIERGWKWVRRDRARAAVILTAAVSMVILSLGSVIFSARVSHARELTEATSRRLARNLFVREWQDAERLIEQDKAAAALMWFARALRNDPDDTTTASRLVSALSAHQFALPVVPALPHTGAVQSSEFSPDGTQLLTAAEDGSVRLWNLASGESQLYPARFASPVAGFIPGDGRILAADQTSVSIWTVDGILQMRRPVTPPYQSRISFSAHGRFVSLFSGEETGELWDLEAFRPVGHPVTGAVQSHSFLLCSPDGRFLVRNSADSELSAWEVESGRCAWMIRAAEPPQAVAFTAGAFSHRGDLLAAGDLLGRVRVYPFEPAGTNPVSSPLPIATILQSDLGQKITALEFDHRDRHLFAGNMDGSVFICDLSSGKLPVSGIEHTGTINDVRSSPNDAHLATASDDGTVRVWDVRMNLSTPRRCIHPGALNDAQFSPDGLRFLTAGTGGSILWDANTGTVLHRFPATGTVTSARFSADGSLVVVSSTSGEVRVWNARTGESVLSPIQFPHTIQSVAFSPDARWFRAAAPGPLVWVHETLTGAPVGRPLTNDAHVVRAPFSPDLRTLAAVTDQGHVTFWTLPDGVRRDAVEKHKGIVWMAGFHPDGTRLLTASSDRRACLWDVASGQILHEFRHEKPVYHARFSPDGRFILTGSADHTAVIWDGETGRRRSEPMRHPGDVWYGEFSSDGRHVITGDDRGNARVWDAASGLPIGTWIQTGSKLKRAVLSRTERLGLAASENGVVRLWHVLAAPAPAPPWLADFAESVAGHRLGDDGRVEPVALSEITRLHQRLKRLSDGSFYSRWVRWFLVERMRENPPDFQP